MSLDPLRPLPRLALWPPSALHLMAVGILSFLLLVAGPRALPLQAAAVEHGVSAPISMAESATPAPAASQGTTPTPVPGSAPALSSTGESAAKTAQQWMAEGHQAQKAGNQMEAVSDFLNAMRLEPASPDPLYALGMSFFLIGWDENDTSYYDRAAHHFKAALDLDPKYDRAAFMMGMMEVVHFRLKEAEPYFQKAITLSPRNHYYHLYYGILLGRMDKYDGAVEQMLLAEKLGPTYAQSYLSLGQLYSQNRKYRQARDQLERAVHLDPSLADAYYTLGGIYHHLGMNTESQSAYETFQRQKGAQPKPDPIVKAMQGSSGTNSK
jgi:tetratricopeptide (TPR) repeat protein